MSNNSQTHVLLLITLLGSLVLNSCVSADGAGKFTAVVRNQATSVGAQAFGCPLAWSDEFEVPGLPDPTRWRYNVGAGLWGNQESQYYTDARLENARVHNGHLIIEAHREPWKGRRYTSARLLTQEEWLYGRFEVSARLPSGRGT